MTKSTKLPILYHHVNSWQSKVTHEWADWGRQWCKNADFWLLSTKIYLLFSLTIRGARLLHLCVRFPVIEAYFACQSYFLQAIPCTFWSPPFLPSVSRLKIHVYRRVNCSRDLLSSIWCSKTDHCNNCRSRTSTKARHTTSWEYAKMKDFLLSYSY